MMRILLVLLICVSARTIFAQDISPRGNTVSPVIVLVSKQNMLLYVFDYQGETLGAYPIACGRNLGDKIQKGDRRTPEGIFRVTQVLDASDWLYPTRDGRMVRGVYGPYFIRVDTPGFWGIGIHGTNAPYSISHRVSKGCIRLRNADLLKLVQQVKPGTVVIIIPSAEDVKSEIAKP